MDLGPARRARRRQPERAVRGDLGPAVLRTAARARGRPGRRRRRAREHQAGVHRRAPAPPARQRASLILCDVLRWKASEVAELLDTSVASVNSALQRARATLAATRLRARRPAAAARRGRHGAPRALRRGVRAVRHDALTSLIQEDASQSMPPYDMWLRGRDDIFTWWFGPGIGCQGSRVLPAPAACGSPAFGQYKPRSQRRPRAVGASGARALRRADRRAHVLPRHRHAVPAVRPAPPARSVGTPASPTKRHQVAQVVACVAKHDLAAHPPRPRAACAPGRRARRRRPERTDVAEGDIRARGFEQRGDAPADRGQVGTGNGPGDGKDDGGRPRGRHL